MMSDLAKLQSDIAAWAQANAQQPNILKRVRFLSTMLKRPYLEEEEVVEILPVDELEERLALASRFCRLRRESVGTSWVFTIPLYVGFFIIPLQVLRDNLQSAFKAGILEVKLKNLLKITRWCKY